MNKEAVIGMNIASATGVWCISGDEGGELRAPSLGSTGWYLRARLPVHSNLADDIISFIFLRCSYAFCEVTMFDFVFVLLGALQGFS